MRRIGFAFVFVPWSLTLPALLAARGCASLPPPSPPSPPPTTAPAAPPLSEQCAEAGKFFDCWALPPGSPKWVYVHGCPSCPGGTCLSTGPAVPCGGSTTPPPGTCAKLASSSPCVGPENTPIGTITTTLFGDAVDAALAKVAGCSVGTDCQVGDGGATAQKEATKAVMRELRAKGFCVSYDLDHGNDGLNSEMGVRRDEETIEFYQILNSAGKVRWSLPGGVRGRCSPPTDEETLEEVESRWPAPPTAPPSTPPTPPGDGGGAACSKSAGDVTEFRTKVKPEAGQSLDSTAEACNFRDGEAPPCDHPQPSLKHCCLLAEEKGNKACGDKLFGEAQWSVVSGDVRIVSPWAGTSTKVKVAEGGGVIKLVGTADPRTAVCLHVAVGVPACTVGPDGGCVLMTCPQ